MNSGSMAIPLAWANSSTKLPSSLSWSSLLVQVAILRCTGSSAREGSATANSRMANSRDVSFFIILGLLSYFGSTFERQDTFADFYYNESLGMCEETRLTEFKCSVDQKGRTN